MNFIQKIIRGVSRNEIAVKENPLTLPSIPDYRKELLYISSEQAPDDGGGLVIHLNLSGDDINGSGVYEPSTIYLTLPVNDRIADFGDVPKMGYFPSYTQMSPEQRYIYLSWLRNVETPIDIGYVFVYFYGLERHLVYGKFDEAVNEIMLLRKHHDNGSFQHYSASALLHACLLKRRVDVLQHLYNDLAFDYFDNSVLLMLYHQQIELNVDMLIRLAMRMRDINRKYLKENPDLYLIALSSELLDTFGRESYPFFEKYTLNKIGGHSYPIFANYSFPDKVRTPKLPNFLDHAPFEREMGGFFKNVHERVKIMKRELKKQSKPVQ